MDKYELFLKELSELCRKHDIEILIDTHATELSLVCASEWKNVFPDWDTILDKDYQFIDKEKLNFGL